LAPFRQLYIADLDAIEGRAANVSALGAVANGAPAVELWVDNGIADADAARAWLDENAHCLVLGSESQNGVETIEALRDDRRVILSLDFVGDAFQGPMRLLEEPDLWPERVIVMTLARVGAAAGPDIDRVAGIVARAQGRYVCGAGGVRDKADLLALSGAGAAGVLVATALHTGVLAAEDLR
jgi:phosphoribosylformimino-5-aminoimidazole carboxamide ribotide isomerase